MIRTQSHRRSFLKSGAAFAAGLPRAAAASAENIKIGHAIPAEASDDFLLFCRQIGLEWARLNYNGDPGVDALNAVVRRFAGHGIRIYGVSHFAYRSLKIQLGQPGRDRDIDTYRTFLRSIGKLGITVAPYDFHPANTYTTGHVRQRGYLARQFSEPEFRARIEKRQFDREYPAAEMWSYYEYFVKAVLPVAGEAGVNLALHPDDPPLAMMNGVAKLFVDYEGYRRAEQIAGGSKHWGLRFCVGTWAEGGARMGKDVFAMIRDFGGRGKLFDIDFRNVNTTLPVFHETLPDDGYLDMYKVMRTLREVRYAGGLVPDHLPEMAGDGPEKRAALAYAIAWLRALLQRANEEAG